MAVELQDEAAPAAGPVLHSLDLDATLATLFERIDYREVGRDVCVRLCDEAESQALNLTYREQNKPTNVLSFAADEAATRHGILGDLAICWGVVEAEAAAQNKRVEQHFLHLFVHGCLHLLGYDHETAEQAEEMEKLEVEVLTQYGVADPYE